MPEDARAVNLIYRVPLKPLGKPLRGCCYKERGLPAHAGMLMVDFGQLLRDPGKLLVGLPAFEGDLRGTPLLRARESTETMTTDWAKASP